MKHLLLSLFILISNIALFGQVNVRNARGESKIHEIGSQNNALYEAIVNAQTNAVVASGGNINLQSLRKSNQNTEIKNRNNFGKFQPKKTYSEESNLTSEHLANAMVRNIEIKIDTVLMPKSRFKIIVNGTFEVFLKDINRQVNSYITSQNKNKIKVELFESDCIGKLYNPLSIYFNSKNNHMVFSNSPWVLDDGDFKIVFNSNKAIIYNLHIQPNPVIKIYEYSNCSFLIGDEGKIILDEIFLDINCFYVYQTELNEIK